MHCSYCLVGQSAQVGTQKIHLLDRTDSCELVRKEETVVLDDKRLAAGKHEWVYCTLRGAKGTSLSIAHPAQIPLLPSPSSELRGVSAMLARRDALQRCRLLARHGLPRQHRQSRAQDSGASLARRRAKWPCAQLQHGEGDLSRQIRSDARRARVQVPAGCRILALALVSSSAWQQEER